MTPFQRYAQAMTRRHFFASSGFSLGSAALATLLGQDGARGDEPGTETGIGAALPRTHFPARAKRIIYLHMVGGPAQMDLYDYKPKMGEFYDKDLPDSVRMGQRLTTMTSGQARFPIAPSRSANRKVAVISSAARCCTPAGSPSPQT